MLSRKSLLLGLVWTAVLATVVVRYRQIEASPFVTLPKKAVIVPLRPSVRVETPEELRFEQAEARLHELVDEEAKARTKSAMDEATREGRSLPRPLPPKPD